MMMVVMPMDVCVQLHVHDAYYKTIKAEKMLIEILRLRVMA